MGRTQLNKELNLSYPDEFKVLSGEDLKKYQFFEEAPGFCINDAECIWRILRSFPENRQH